MPGVHSTLVGVQWGLFILSPVIHFLFLRFWSQWPSFVQFGKFCMISFSNLVIDFGILNLLIYYSGVAEGVLYSVFKAVSFILANVNGYAWNKFWTFQSNGAEGWMNQLIRFFVVVGVGLVINVAVATYVVAEFGGSGGGHLLHRLGEHRGRGVSPNNAFLEFFSALSIWFLRKNLE